MHDQAVPDDAHSRPALGSIPVSKQSPRSIVGQKAMIQRLAGRPLDGGHNLLEGVPGLAKTLAVRTLPRGLHLPSSASSSRRTCCRPTLSARKSTIPASGEFFHQEGPVSPTWSWPMKSTAPRPRSRSALLEAMQENR